MPRPPRARALLVPLLLLAVSANLGGIALGNGNFTAGGEVITVTVLFFHGFVTAIAAPWVGGLVVRR